MINVTDRVPTQELTNGAVRYGIYDSNGNLLRYEYIKREDEPTNEGTPINKVLFDSIQADLTATTGKVERVDRYTTPTPSRETENGEEYNLFTINKDGITEYFEDMKIDIRRPTTEEYTSEQMTPEEFPNENTYKGFILSGSSGGVWTAVGENSAYYMYNTGYEADYWQIEFPFYFKNISLEFQSLNYNNNGGHTYISTDGSNWTEITTTSSGTGSTTWERATLTDNVKYKFVKITGRFSSSAMTIAHFRVLSGTREIFDYSERTFLKINNLEKKEVLFSPNTLNYWNLLYNNNKFIDRRPQTTTDSIKITSGTISNSGVIPVDNNYEHHYFIVSLHSWYQRDQNSSYTEFQINCSVNQVTGEVTVTGGSSRTANYWCIHWNDITATRNI